METHTFQRYETTLQSVRGNNKLLGEYVHI